MFIQLTIITTYNYYVQQIDDSVAAVSSESGAKRRAGCATRLVD